jgi:hypothetical protein
VCEGIWGGCKFIDGWCGMCGRVLWNHEREEDLFHRWERVVLPSSFCGVRQRVWKYVLKECPIKRTARIYADIHHRKSVSDDDHREFEARMQDLAEKAGEGMRVRV